MPEISSTRTVDRYTTSPEAEPLNRQRELESAFMRGELTQDDIPDPPGSEYDDEPEEEGAAEELSTVSEVPARKSVVVVPKPDDRVILAFKPDKRQVILHFSLREESTLKIGISTLKITENDDSVSVFVDTSVNLHIPTMTSLLFQFPDGRLISVTFIGAICDLGEYRVISFTKTS